MPRQVNAPRKEEGAIERMPAPHAFEVGIEFEIRMIIVKCPDRFRIVEPQARLTHDAIDILKGGIVAERCLDAMEAIDGARGRVHEAKGEAAQPIAGLDAGEPIEQ